MSLVASSVDVSSSRSQQTLQEKQDWVKQMRLKFSVRKAFPVTNNVIHPDGTLNQTYFRPVNGSVMVEACAGGTGGHHRQWTLKEKELLVQGLKAFGVGQFRQISETLLPEWDPNELRIKTMRLLGRQNLTLYKNKTFQSVDEIQKEYERNKELGLKLGAWKSGTLVYDEAGLVLDALLELQRLENESEGMEEILPTSKRRRN